MLWDVGKGLDPKRDERKTSCTAGDEVCRGRRDVLREMRHTAGGRCRRQVWRRKTSHGAEDLEAEGTLHQEKRKLLNLLRCP